MKKIVLVSLFSVLAANVAFAAVTDDTSVSVTVASVNEIIAPADLADSIDAGEASAGCADSGMAADLSFKSQSASGATVRVDSLRGFNMVQMNGLVPVVAGDQIAYSIMVATVPTLGSGLAEDAPNNTPKGEVASNGVIHTLPLGDVWGSATQYSESKVCLKFAGGANTFKTAGQYKDVLTFSIADI